LQAVPKEIANAVSIAAQGSRRPGAAEERIGSPGCVTSRGAPCSSSATSVWRCGLRCRLGRVSGAGGVVSVARRPRSVLGSLGARYPRLRARECECLARAIGRACFVHGLADVPSAIAVPAVGLRRCVVCNEDTPAVRAEARHPCRASAASQPSRGPLRACHAPESSGVHGESRDTRRELVAPWEAYAAATRRDADQRPAYTSPDATKRRLRSHPFAPRRLYARSR